MKFDKLKVKRVQKYIEALDMLKIRNSGQAKAASQQRQIFAENVAKNYEKKQEQRKQGSLIERVNPRQVVVTTKWETF